MLSVVYDTHYDPKNGSEQTETDIYSNIVHCGARIYKLQRNTASRHLASIATTVLLRMCCDVYERTLVSL